MDRVSHGGAFSDRFAQADSPMKRMRRQRAGRLLRQVELQVDERSHTVEASRTAHGLLVRSLSVRPRVSGQNLWVTLRRDQTRAGRNRATQHLAYGTNPE